MDKSLGLKILHLRDRFCCLMVSNGGGMSYLTDKEVRA